MNTQGDGSRGAFTRAGLLVIVAVVLILAVLLTTALSNAAIKSHSICCNCNLKQLGTAYRIWANDHAGLFPSETSVQCGGWSNILARANPASFCWTNYAIMSNELGESTYALACPVDHRRRAADFAHFTNNLSLSYFVGVAVDDNWPQGLLGGDRNICADSKPTDDYGFSPENGQGSNAVIAGSACWSRKMHSRHHPGGFGNILLGDGGAEQCDSANFTQNWLKSAQETAAARAGAVGTVGIRLIFP